MIADHVFAAIVLDACNPSPMTGDGNNTYLVVDAGDGVLIDAGVGHPDHLSELARSLTDAGAALASVAVTHGHTDHASGAPAIRSRSPGKSSVFHPGATSICPI